MYYPTRQAGKTIFAKYLLKKILKSNDFLHLNWTLNWFMNILTWQLLMPSRFFLNTILFIYFEYFLSRYFVHVVGYGDPPGRVEQPAVGVYHP